jgi:acetyl-CoA acyltransferase 2
MLGEAKIVLAGGSENMSQAPYAVRGIRDGTRFGVDLKMEDTLSNGLIDSYPEKIPMVFKPKQGHHGREPCQEIQP